MNIYRIGFYHDTTPDAVLVVFAESEAQAKQLWPNVTERGDITVEFDGVLHASVAHPTGVVVRLGHWVDRSHPGLVFNTTPAQHSWLLQNNQYVSYRGCELHSTYVPASVKLYLVYPDRATSDDEAAGIIVGATSPEEAYTHWNANVSDTVCVSELPFKAGLVTTLRCEQDRKRTWVIQKALPETAFEYTPEECGK